MTLRLSIPVSLSLLLLIVFVARAQTADEFFNGGAQLYISNNIPAALEKTENGLKLYPDDVKLQKLEKLLKQQQQNQQNQSQQNQKQSQQNQNSQSQQQKSSQQKNQQQANQQAAQQQSSPTQKKSAEEKKEQGSAMTPQEARQLLDAQKDGEQFLQMTPQGKPHNENQPVKDW